MGIIKVLFNYIPKETHVGNFLRLSIYFGQDKKY